jgi:Phosphopantetheine attachment site
MNLRNARSGTNACGARGYEAPVGLVEETLAQIWAGVLKTERVGQRDNFFDLGGHSLLAGQVVSRVRRVLGVEASLSDLFNRPRIAELASILQASRAARPAERSAIHNSRL